MGQTKGRPHARRNHPGRSPIAAPLAQARGVADRHGVRHDDGVFDLDGRRRELCGRGCRLQWLGSGMDALRPGNPWISGLPSDLHLHPDPRADLRHPVTVHAWPWVRADGGIPDLSGRSGRHLHLIAGLSLLRDGRAKPAIAVAAERQGARDAGLDRFSRGAGRADLLLKHRPDVGGV